MCYIIKQFLFTSNKHEANIIVHPSSIIKMYKILFHCVLAFSNHKTKCNKVSRNRHQSFHYFQTQNDNKSEISFVYSDSLSCSIKMPATPVIPSCIYLNWNLYASHKTIITIIISVGLAYFNGYVCNVSSSYYIFLDNSYCDHLIQLFCMPTQCGPCFVQ